ncbi:acetyl-CoA acetyltransferase [Piscinibacter sakaiensis]|uniref:3-ketoacyl-CoA thiolase n=1 Tax=Piscinibacter sakaiensis TaxID=1547922 RepID=A0A0K8P3M3_PISS1|nr:acetyl-CoA acetyltransferase [Piscinibacter sakaiensis]GAP37149.1 3-ketoacyl-CoA thiolase [Piscinibacter sakaiensis]
MKVGARSLKGRAAIVGIGESTYYRHGTSPDPEFKLVLKAILAACADAGIDPRDIDGFASYGNDRSDPLRLATALGTHRLRSSMMQWGGGGGGCCAAVANGAAAIHAGMAEVVVVYRGLAQGEYGRFGQGGAGDTVSGEMAWQVPYGVLAPPQKFAMRVQRYLHEHGIRPEALRAIAMASYHHAQANPRAVMHGKPLSEARYDASRWIVEPLRLYDCCMENDGAAALLLVSADAAKRFGPKAAWLLGAGGGADHRFGAVPHNAPDYASANYKGVASDLYRMAGLGPADVGVVQSYENFTGGVVMALAEHGFFSPSEANDFLQTADLLAPDGRLPLNTSGGNLAECYMHGFELVLEAVRQVRGTSTSQARRHDVALVIGGPMVAPASDLLLGSEAAL